MKNKKLLFIIFLIIFLIVLVVVIKNKVNAQAEPSCRYQSTGQPYEGSSCTLGTVYWDGSKCMQHKYCPEKLNCLSTGTGASCTCGTVGQGPIKDFPIQVSCPGCTGCATAKCGECSSQAAGYRCKCTGSTGIPGYYTSCTGQPDSSCTGSSKQCTDERYCVETCPSGHYCYGNCVTNNDCGTYATCGAAGQPCCTANGGTCNSGLTCCDPKNGQPAYCTSSCGTGGGGNNCPAGYSCQPPGSPCSGESLGAGSCGYAGQNYYCCKSGGSSQGCEFYPGYSKCSCSDPNFSKRAPNGDCCCLTPPSGPSYSCTCTLKANPNPIPSGQNTTYITAESKPDSRVPDSDFEGCQVSYYVREYGLLKPAMKILPANITQDENTMTYNGACMYFVYVGSQAYNYDCSCDVTVTKETNVPSVSCSASPNPANVGQTVTWTATSSNFSGTPTYTWSGAVSGTGASLTTSYSNTGTSTANIVASYGTQTATSSCSVSIIPVPTQPDLIIDSLSANPSSPSQEATFTVTVKEKNIGQARAGQHILKVIDEDGVEVFTKTIDNLDSGATTPSYTFNHTCVSGGETKIYTAKADSENQIAESNENNNEKTLTVVCPGLCHSAALELTKNNTCPDGSVNVSGGTVSLKLTQNNGTKPYRDIWHCYKGAQEIPCGFSPQTESTRDNTVNKNNLKWWSGTGTYSASVTVEDSSTHPPCPPVATNVVSFTVSSCPGETKCNTSTYKCDTSGAGPECNTGPECCSLVYGSDYQCTTGACQSRTDKGQTFCPSGQKCCKPTTICSITDFKINNTTQPVTIFLGRSFRASWDTINCERCYASCTPREGCAWDYGNTNIGITTNPSYSTITPAKVGEFTYTLTCENDYNSDFRTLPASADEGKRERVIPVPWWREIIPNLSAYLRGLIIRQ